MLNTLFGAILEKGFGLAQRIHLPDVKDFEVGLRVCLNLNVAAYGEVEVDDGEGGVGGTAALGKAFQQWEKRGRKSVNAVEGKVAAAGGHDVGVGRFDLAGFYVRPPHEAVALVEEQVARGFALAGDEHDGNGRSLGIEAANVEIAEDIDVVNKDVTAGFAEEGRGVEQSSARVEQALAFVAHAYAKREGMRLDVVA